MWDRCARCDCPVGLGNLARDYKGLTVRDDCLTVLVEQDSPGNRLIRWMEKIERIFRG